MEWSEGTAVSVANEAAEEIGLGGDAEVVRVALSAVVRFDDHVIKVLAPGHRSLAELSAEHRLVRRLHDAGIPTPEPVGEAWAVRGLGVAVSRYVEADDETSWAAVGSSARRLHECDVSIGDDLVRMRGRDDLSVYRRRIVSIAESASDDETSALEAMLGVLEGTSAVVDGARSLVHGDLHSGNVRMRHGEAVLLDWEKADIASPLVDVWKIRNRVDRHGLDAAAWEGFVRAYGRAMEPDPAVAELLDVSWSLGGITYLMLAPGARQRAEGRRRLHDLMHGRPTRWIDC